MTQKTRNQNEFDAPSGPATAQDESLQRIDSDRFTQEMDQVIREAETLRMQYMNRYQKRSFISFSIGLISLLCGAGGFGWYLLMEPDIVRAVACIALSIVLPLLLHGWSQHPLKAYKLAYKAVFMPRLARALGGFQFHAERAVSAGILSKTGIFPAFDRHSGEDCFRGRYQDMKVLLSELRLFHRKAGPAPVFQGLVVLLEMPQNRWSGHTILTADRERAKSWAGTRWKALSPVPVHPAEEAWNRFSVFSSAPEEASKIAGDRVLKEMAEAADVFKSSLLSVALFGNKYVCIAIPNTANLFEPSSIHVPVSTRQHAQQCRKEVGQLLEVIDIFSALGDAAGPDIS